ncbi:MAG: RNA polymerase sigma factor [Firmicutes bacterium]|nr:RNA polymerase sigma factor [Bacillota bacterium]
MDNGASSYRRFLAGDENAFVEIVDEYRESLIFFLYRYVGDLHAAEDLAEDVFVEVLLHPKRFRFQCALKTWIFTIGRNKAVDFLRKTSRLQVVPLDEAERLAEVSNLEDAVLGSEEKHLLNGALGEISEDYRMALHLVYFEDLSHEEAARVMKKNRKQVENLVYRGKQSLRKILEREGYENER